MPTHSEMANVRVPLTLIVATTTNLGIGINGQLPWRIKSEMQYFARVTSRVPASFQTSGATRPVQNAVIMGRKTWASIPARFRPLKNRLNIVLSRQTAPFGVVSLEQKDGAVWAKSLEDALRIVQKLNSTTELDPKESDLPCVARGFIIGGAEVYREGIESGKADSVLLTRVHGDWECDAFFPIDLDNDKTWKRQEFKQLQEFTGEDELVEGNVKEGDMEFEYRLYTRTS
jgi:dihydrofolate reductase